MWCYFCDDAKGGTLFPSSVTCIFPLFEHSKGSTFIRLSKRIERIFAFFCLLFYTLYIYAGARFAWLCPSWSRTTTPHYTTHHAHQGSSFWSILEAFCFSSSPHENREFTEERADGSEFSILRNCVILECLGGFLFPSPRENWEFVTRGSGGSEFSILKDCLLEPLGGFLFLFSLLARIGNLWREGGAAQNSRFSGILSSRALRTLLPARIENPWIGGLGVRNWWFSERTSLGRGNFFSFIQISLQLFVKFGIRVRQTPIGH